jgi:hypothetical protein
VEDNAIVAEVPRAEGRNRRPLRHGGARFGPGRLAAVRKEEDMNICMTHYAFFPTTGGVESHLLDLCAGLKAAGHNVLTLVGSLEGRPKQETVEGIPVYRTDLMNPE